MREVATPSDLSSWVRGGEGRKERDMDIEE